MRIGVLAKRAGVSTSSIRFYERRGLLPAPERLPSGYREYDGRALEIILFINQARGLGFNLAEIAAHIHSPKDSSRKLKLLSSMEKKLGEFDALLADLQSRRAALFEAIEELRRRTGRA